MRKSATTGTLRVALAIGRVSFQEIIRDKVLYNVLLCAVFLLSLGFLASQLTFARPDRVILDFGISAIGISTGLIAVLIGSSCLGREFDRRTYHVVLSRPITRVQFVIGKFCGLSGVLALNGGLLAAAFLLIYLLSGGATSATLLLAILLLIAQSLLLAAFALFFSSFTTTSLAAVFTIGLYLIGTNVSTLRHLALKLESPAARGLLEAVAVVLPNFELFNQGTKVTYHLPLGGTFVLGSFAYALVMVSLSVLGAGLLANRRES